MNKMMSVVMVGFAVVFMIVISGVYSFSTIEISKMAYMAMWVACIGIMRIALSFLSGLER